MTASRYSLAARALHWLMAINFILLFASGAYMVGMDADDPLRGSFYGWHKSLGVLALSLLLLRILVRLLREPPALPLLIHGWQRQTAHRGHQALYLIMLAVPLAGWMCSNFYDKDVAFFGLPLPRLFPALGVDAGNWAGEVHTVLAYGLLGLVVVHLLAVIKHQYDGVNVLGRMR